jgi:dihydrofolate synthase/folylpolyglutamate synthase
LVEQLQASPVTGKTHMVIAMLADKPVMEVVQLLAQVVDSWYSAGLESVDRGLSSKEMTAAVDSLGTGVKLCADSMTVEQALLSALDKAEKQDRIVVTGSFYTVAAALQYFLNG